jgi:hypothetical protein
MSVFGRAQFCEGDQGERKWKFQASYMAECPACNSKDIVEEKFPEACRMNGDAYGTSVFTCKECKWKTSFQWDDSSDNYYYEKPPISNITKLR